MAKPKPNENKIHVVKPAVHGASTNGNHPEVENATPDSRLTKPHNQGPDALAGPTILRTKNPQSRLEQVARRMSLTILYTSADNKAKDLPSIGWLTLDDEVSDGVWSKQIGLGKPEVLELYGCPLVQKIASKAAPSNDDSRSFELTEKAFKRCEKLLSAMMGPLQWEFHFTRREAELEVASK